MHEHEPIEWESLALVGFVNNRPCLITSIKPHVIFHTLADLVNLESWDWDDEISVSDVVNRIHGMRWELHPVEIAKEIFCSRNKVEQTQERPMTEPLPGQLSIPYEE